MTFIFSSPDSDVDHFECSSGDGTDFTTCTTPFQYPSVDQGTQTFYVRAVDSAGNTGPSSSFTWTLDTTPPNTVIVEPAKGIVDGASLLIYPQEIQQNQQRSHSNS